MKSQRALRHQQKVQIEKVLVKQAKRVVLLEKDIKKHEQLIEQEPIETEKLRYQKKLERLQASFKKVSRDYEDMVMTHKEMDEIPKRNRVAAEELLKQLKNANSTAIV